METSIVFRPAIKPYRFAEKSRITHFISQSWLNELAHCVEHRERPERYNNGASVLLCLCLSTQSFQPFRGEGKDLNVKRPCNALISKSSITLNTNFSTSLKIPSGPGAILSFLNNLKRHGFLKEIIWECRNPSTDVEERDLHLPLVYPPYPLTLRG